MNLALLDDTLAVVFIMAVIVAVMWIALFRLMLVNVEMSVAMAMAVAVTMVMTVVVLMMIWSDIANDNTAILLSRIGIEDSDCPTHN